MINSHFKSQYFGEFISDLDRQLTTIANLPSYYKEKVAAMGFELHPATVFRRFDGDYDLVGSFMCVCGTYEKYNFRISAEILFNKSYDLIDPAYRLWREGSFSKQHLLSDGYSIERVEEILAKGRDYDARKSRERDEILKL